VAALDLPGERKQWNEGTLLFLGFSDKVRDHVEVWFGLGLITSNLSSKAMMHWPSMPSMPNRTCSCSSMESSRSHLNCQGRKLIPGNRPQRPVGQKLSDSILQPLFAAYSYLSCACLFLSWAFSLPPWALSFAAPAPSLALPDIFSPFSLQQKLYGLSIPGFCIATVG
jgi:hypothetical protein